jgi:hypothetical protein
MAKKLLPGHGLTVNNIVIVRAACRLAAVLLFFFLACGCQPPYRPTKIPIDTIRYDAPGGPHRQLFVFLPGYGDKPSAFDQHGLLPAVRARGLAADIVAVDAHLGYYVDGTILTRLKEDVIDPARAGGYKQIWLIGNSLGAYGAISYARVHPHDITGVVLLGPYMGEKKTIREIREAGGLQKWDPGTIGDKTKEEWVEQIWLWIKNRQQRLESRLWGNGCEEERGCLPEIYLGYGKSDRFSYGQNLLAEVLPPEHVVAIEGGHNWTTWKKLWNIILDKIAFRKPAAPSQTSRESRRVMTTASLTRHDPLSLDLSAFFQ